VNDRIDPLRRVDGGTDRLEAVTRLSAPRRRRDDEDDALPDDRRRPPRRPVTQPKPPDDGQPHVDVRA
jgi:hypothetical protein